MVLIPLRVVCGCSNATAAKMSSYNTNLRPTEPNIFIIWPFIEKEEGMENEK